MKIIGILGSRGRLCATADHGGMCQDLACDRNRTRLLETIQAAGVLQLPCRMNVRGIRS